MRYVSALALLFALAWLHATGQQNVEALQTAEAGPTVPVLLPSATTVSTPKHCDELNGFVKFAATIDTAGLPHELKMLEASDRRLVGFATEIAEAQRFKPATIDDAPAAVAVELAVGLQTCAQREKHPDNGDFYRFTLRTHPMIALALVTHPAVQTALSAASTEPAKAEQAGGHISTPTPTILTDPEIPASKKFQKRGRCFLSVMIDASGVPQNIRVFQELEPELDSNAIEAVKNWRFKPALRDDNSPVSVEGTVVATFEYVEKKPVAFAVFIPYTPEKVLAANDHAGKQHFSPDIVNADEVVARYKPETRIAGLCLVSLEIDTTGVPRNVHIVKGLDSDQDMDTVAMVEHLRFKPILGDGGKPIPVGIIMPLRYRKTVQKPEWRDIFFDLAEIPIFFFM